MAGKPARSGPPGHQNATKHGYYMLRAMRKGGKLNGNEASRGFNRAFNGFVREYSDALGGNVSPQQTALIIDNVWIGVYMASLNAHLGQLKRLVRKGKPHPALEVWMRLVGLRRENFKTLGIKRVPKELPDLTKALSLAMEEEGTPKT